MMSLMDEWTDTLFCLQLNPERALALENLHVAWLIKNNVTLRAKVSKYAKHNLGYFLFCFFFMWKRYKDFCIFTCFFENLKLIHSKM